jgi:hypothetical protein
MATRKSAQSPMQKQFSETYSEQRKEMFLHVARELTGRAKQRQLPKGKALDWEKFNEYFNNFYADATADELLEEILDNVYWLASEQAVIDLHFRYISDAVKAANAKKGKADGEDIDSDDFIK